jgi:UDP-N-acetylmuramate--alanine ligase
MISASPPEVPEGWEPVVSTAYAGLVSGRSRGELLAEIVVARKSIVVAGAHGKTTTAAMIAFCLDALGLDPAFLIGGQVPQLGANARAGEGWLVAEGDESDRSLELLRPEIGVLTNVDLDHHATFASRAEVEELFERWLAGCGSVVRGEELEPVAFELAVAGEHNRRNAATALAALELAGVDGAAAAEALAGFRGAGRRLEPRGSTGGVTVYDDYAHHPAEIEATLEALAELHPGARIVVLFQPHLYSRTQHLAGELGLRLRDGRLPGSREAGCGRHGQARRRRARPPPARDVDRLGSWPRGREPHGRSRCTRGRRCGNDRRRQRRRSGPVDPGGACVIPLETHVLFPPGRFRARPPEVSVAVKLRRVCAGGRPTS